MEDLSKIVTWLIATMKGLNFFFAKVNGQLKELVSRRNDVIGLLNSFTQFDSGSAGSVTAPLVVIQTTKFDCEGLAIGISICHAIADGFTMVHFVTAWATANRAGINQSTDQISTWLLSARQKIFLLLSLILP